MRLTSEQTKRIMEVIAEEMGIQLGDTIRFDESDSELRINSKGCFTKTIHTSLEAILGGIICGVYSFERLPWEPGCGEMYYYPNPTEFNGVGFVRCTECDFDFMIKDRVGVYRTREEALRKARELGWVE